MAKPVVSTKNTKAEILSAYEEALAAVNEKKAVSLNPVAVKKAKRRKQVIAETADLSTDVIEKNITTVRNRAFTLLNDLERTLKEEVGNLRTVEEGIGLRQAELQDVFGIENEAGSLAALVEAQTARKAQFDTDMVLQRDSFREEMAKARKVWVEEKAEHQRVYSLACEQDTSRRDRELEEHKYTFGRTEQARLDGLGDQLTQQRKAYAAEVEIREKNLAERAEVLVKDETVHADALAKVIQLEADIVTKVVEASESAKKGMTTSNNIAQNAIKKDYEAQITVLKGGLTNATQRADFATQRIDKLEADLAVARTEVQAVALRALDAQAGKASLEAVQTALTNNSQRK